jgi:hypothetical protein
MVLMQNEEPDAPPLKVTQFHYLAWPDHGVPNNAISMINFIKRVRKAHPYDRQDLLLVHCSAGVGRTGTFITLDSMLERIKAENSVNIFEFVSNLRKQRVLMVQTLVRIASPSILGIDNSTGQGYLKRKIMNNMFTKRSSPITVTFLYVRSFDIVE